MFGLSKLEKETNEAFDQFACAVIPRGAEFVEEHPLLKNINSRRAATAFSYFALVAAVDIIHLQSITRYGPGSAESKKIAKALRRRFEASVDDSLVKNLGALRGFCEQIEEEKCFLSRALLPEDLHGAWVVMAFDGQNYVDFTDPEVVDTSKKVSAWLRKGIGQVTW